VTPYFSAGLILIETYHKILKQYEQRKRMLANGEKKPKKESSWINKLAKFCGDDDEENVKK